MAGTKKETQEQRVAASSYVITFYQTVQTLTSQYANYCNVLEELEFKYGKEIDKLDEEHKQITIQVTQQLKYYVRHVKVQFETTKAAAKVTEKESKKLEAVYNKVMKEFVPKKKDVEEYVIAINQYMASKVMKDLLSSSENLVESLYE